MINITRQKDSPNSLNTLEIRQYINEAVLFLNNPAENAKPAKPVSYRNSDLLDAFDQDFYSKCYLTELKFSNSYIMDIEHFVPQNERPDLVYEWSNLFPAEHYTNMIKPRTTPLGGYLDPCNQNENVEEEIVYTLSPYGYDPFFQPSDDHNQKAQNTCDLLNRVHNGHDVPTKKATLNLRHSIHKRYIDILHKINEWRSRPDGTQEKAQAERELRNLISRKSSFTMLIRSMPAVHQLPIDFLD